MIRGLEEREDPFFFFLFEEFEGLKLGVGIL